MSKTEEGTVVEREPEIQMMQEILFLDQFVWDEALFALSRSLRAGRPRSR